MIRYQPLTSGTTYHVETKQGKKVGKVIREKKGETIFYTFVDLEEQSLASGPTERNQTDTTVHLSDKNGESLGFFSAEIYNLYPTEYRVFTKNKLLIAKGYMHWLGNNFALADPENPKRFLVTFSRPMFKLFNDYWHFDIHEEGAIDLYLLSVMGAFQTACDLNFEMLEPPKGPNS